MEATLSDAGGGFGQVANAQCLFASACVRMLDWFEHCGHVCIVFELLGLSTSEVLQRNHFLPFDVEQIRHMAFQIFRAVCCE